MTVTYLRLQFDPDADAIITFNQRDFDETVLTKFDLYTEHPDEFVSNMISIYTPRVISAVREMRQRLRNPPKDVDDFLGTLLTPTGLATDCEQIVRFRGVTMT